MMPTYRRSSVVYTSLLLGQGTRYQPEAWPANDGSIRCSVDFEPGGGRCCIQGTPAALRELAAALIQAADQAEERRLRPSRWSEWARERLGAVQAANLAPTGWLGRPP